MGLLLSSLFEALTSGFGGQEARILLLGLDAAGKTSKLIFMQKNNFW